MPKTRLEALITIAVFWLALGARAAAPAADDAWLVLEGKVGPGKGKHILLISGDEEYRSEEALPQLGKILAFRHGFRCTVLFAIDRKDGTINPEVNDNIPGLDALAKADLVVIATRFRNLPDDQMSHVVDYVESGKPVIGLRTATHAFSIPKDRKYARYGFDSKEWDGGFGRQVLGETWINHHGQHGKESTRGVIAKGMEDHPILRGVKDVWGPTDVYGVRLPLPGDSKPLILGQVLAGMKPGDEPVVGKKNDPMMPVAWIKTYAAPGGKTGRVFTTTMGASQDLESEGFRRLLVNACYWALRMEEKIDPRSSVDIVGKFEPSPFRFGGARKGLKPADLIHTAAASPAGPVKALLITGGCCHDYVFQAKALQEAPGGKGLVEWKVVKEGGNGTRGQITLYDDPRWADGFDIVVHNECFADTDDADYIRRIVDAHRGGVPAVVIHCAMHTYRAAKIDDWREFLGVTSREHEHQSRYPVTTVAREHPVLAHFPDAWTTPKDELYVIEKLWPGATALATAKSERTGKEHPVFWVNAFGKTRVFGTTFGHSSETFADPVFLETVLRGLLWAAGRLEGDGPASGAPAATVADWAHGVKLPAGEKATDLFNGKDLTGWEGEIEKYWSVVDGAIRGANTGRVPASTYLFTRKSYRDFRLLLEVKQTRSPEHSTMHSAVAVLGEKIEDGGSPFGFRGPLLMFANDWGIWDAHRRNRVHPAGHEGTWNPAGIERVGDWNRIEILVRGERIRFVANGKLVFDFTDKPDVLRASPIGLQLHSNDRPQEHRFRGLVIVENPKDELATMAP